MLALSIRQPHVHAILHLGKRFENREDSRGVIPNVCRHVGPLLLHASGSMTQREFWEALNAWRDDGRITALQDAELAPIRKTLPLGGIVGYARAIGRLSPDITVPIGLRRRQAAGWFWDGKQKRRISEVVQEHGLDLRWWAGGHALVLTDVHSLLYRVWRRGLLLPFVACPGRLGLWRPPADVLRRLGPALRAARAVHGSGP